MKRCPNCHLNYSDNAMEFCLEDGAKLIFLPDQTAEAQTVTSPSKVKQQTTEKTINLPFSNQPANLNSPGAGDVQPVTKTALLKEKVVYQSNRVLEVAPIVISLAHNWWQWIYLNNQSYSSFSTYILSANFLIWLLLLMIGAVIGLLALKRCQNKSFAIISLVILAVNLLLFLVPKR